MKLEIEEELVKEYGDILKISHFECDDGWFNLIKCVLSSVKRHIKWSKNPPIDFKFVQIKEKFGMLRMYSEGGNDYIAGIVSLAEELSYKTCEVTGMPGSIHVKTYWLKTLSDDEAKKLGFTKYVRDE